MSLLQYISVRHIIHKFYAPETRGNEKVDDTPPITAMIENENATVSMS